MQMLEMDCVLRLRIMMELKWRLLRDPQKLNNLMHQLTMVCALLPRMQSYTSSISIAIGLSAECELDIITRVYVYLISAGGIGSINLINA